MLQTSWSSHTNLLVYLVWISQKVLAILVHQEAAKLPAIKVFVASKSSVLCSKWPDFGAKKTLTAGHFVAP